MTIDNSSKTIKVIKRITFIFMCLTFIISLPTLFIWVFGASSGSGNADGGESVRKGLVLGFTTHIYYVTGCGSLISIYTMAALDIFRRQRSSTHEPVRFLVNLNTIIVGIFWIFFSYCAFNFYRAFQIINSNF